MVHKNIYFFLLGAKLIFAEENSFVKFQKFISYKENCIFTLEINQKQFGTIHKSFGSLQYISKDYYIFDDLNQRIEYKGNTIKTINKNSKQIIFDTFSNNDFNVLDIITGNNVGINIKNRKIDNGITKASFYIDDWSIKGVLWTKSETGEPKKIKLITNEDEQIEINILASSFSQNDSLSTLDTSGFEIINLREQTF